MRTLQKSIKFLACFIVMVMLACSPKTYNSSTSIGGPGQKAPPPKPNAAPGECFALADIPRKFESVTETYYEYTGMTVPDSGVVSTLIELQPRSESWVKKPSKNCQSLDPDDCLIWCLEVKEQKTITINEVQDTSILKDYKEKSVVVTRMLNDNYQEWVRVVCESDMNQLLILSVSDSLRVNGYSVPFNCRKSVNCLVEPLRKYQKARSLPMGSLNHATLDSLGIMY